MTEKLKNSAIIKNSLLLLILVAGKIHQGFATDVEVTSYLTDESLNFKVHLPVLSCYVKYAGYKSVIWYKDSINVKNGSADPPGHTFSVASLLHSTRSNTNFDNPLKLQGYYWCKTDIAPADDSVHKFLYQIETVNTFVSFLLATEDSLGDDHSITEKEKINKKIEIYTHGLQDVLFGFMQKPNIFVTHIKETASGLEVHFLLYALQTLDARLRGNPRLIEDEHVVHDIEDYLHNKTETDPELHEEILEWVEVRGIDIDKISFKSTIGCYAEKTFNPDESFRELSWPYTFLKDIAIPEESCTAANDLPVTRKCDGSFSDGAKWSPIYGICENEPSSFTKSLKNLSQNIRKNGLSETLEELNEILQDTSKIKVIDLIIAANTIGMATLLVNFEGGSEGSIFSSIDAMLKVDDSILNKAKLDLQFTDRILTIINNVIEIANEDQVTIEISKSTLLVSTKDTEIGDRHVNGAAIFKPASNSTLEENSIKFLINGSAFPYYESIAGFLLPTELVVKREIEVIFPCQLNMIYFKDWKLFQEPQLTKKNSGTLLTTPVMSISISGGPAWNLTDPLRLYFKHDFQDEIGNPLCIYFDPKLGNDGNWATEGCSYEGLLNGYHICHCHHLSTFSIILTKKEVYRQPIFRSHVSLYVGCGVSLIGLTIVVFLYVTSKFWRQTIDQDILFHLALSFLGSIILLFLHETRPHWEPGCLLISHAFYCTVLTMFCWLFVQSIVYHIRFSKKAETGDISHFLMKCIAFAWGMPVVIIGIIGLSKKYGYYEQKNCWPTLEEVSGAAFIPVIIMICLAFILYLNAAYSISCRYKKDLLVGQPKYKEAALKFRASVTLFLVLILSWLFAYVALWDQRKEMQILFSIFIIVSSIYISLLFIFHELSLSELLHKRRAEISEPTTQIRSYDNQTYKSTES